MVIYIDRYSRSKKVQPGNREWAIAIECMNNDSFIMPLFLMVQSINHFAFWYTEYDLPIDWMIKILTNDWISNDIVIKWI